MCVCYIVIKVVRCCLVLSSVSAIPLHFCLFAIAMLICRSRLYPLSTSFASQGQQPLSGSTSAGKKALTPVWKRGVYREKITQPITFPFSCFSTGKDKRKEATDSGDSQSHPAMDKEGQATNSKGPHPLPPPPARSKGEQATDSGDSQQSPPLSPINLTLSQMNLFAADSEIDGAGSSVGRWDNHGICSSSAASEIAVPGDSSEVDDNEQLADRSQTEGIEKRCSQGQPISDVSTDGSRERWSSSTMLVVKRQTTSDVVDSGSQNRIADTPERDARQGNTGSLWKSGMAGGSDALLNTTGKHTHDFLTESHSSDTVSSGKLMTPLPCRESMEESSDGVCSASREENAVHQAAHLAIHTTNASTKKKVQVVDGTAMGKCCTRNGIF